MKSFIKDNKKSSNREEDTVKGRPFEKMETLKRRLASFLGWQSEKLSSPQKKLALLCFGILMGGISLALIVRPFQNVANGTFTIPEGMEATIIIVPPGMSEPVISPEDFQMLLGFKSTLDSLYMNDRPTYDELLRGREGLLDSINFLISIYNQ